MLLLRYSFWFSSWKVRLPPAFTSCFHKYFSSLRNAGNGVLKGKIRKNFPGWGACPQDSLEDRAFSAPYPCRWRRNLVCTTPLSGIPGSAPDNWYTVIVHCPGECCPRKDYCWRLTFRHSVLPFGTSLFGNENVLPELESCYCLFPKRHFNFFDNFFETEQRWHFQR